MHDVITAWPQWTVVTLLVILHTCITFLVDVPGCGKGYIGPGGLDEGGNYYNCTGGVAGYMDRQVFGQHMYKDPPCKRVYETMVYYDPEGRLNVHVQRFPQLRRYNDTGDRMVSGRSDITSMFSA